jgi:hypothetical protein
MYIQIQMIELVTFIDAVTCISHMTLLDVILSALGGAGEQALSL